MAAIPTTYDGIEYRSRLEARWAAFMANIGWDTVYEPFDGDGYIPDFLVQGDNPLLIEVKPASIAADYLAAVPKAESGLEQHWTHDILIVGSTPFPTVNLGYGSQHPAGLLGEHGGAGWDGWRWGEAEWHLCVGGQPPPGWVDNLMAWEPAGWVCGTISVHHTEMSYASRPCGHYDGDHYIYQPPTRLMSSMWADACNDVKWRGRAA